MSQVARVINNTVGDLVDEYEWIDGPEDVNRGHCTTVAANVCEEIPEAEKHVAKNVFTGGTHREYPAHTWVSVDGLYYDAERPQGTAYWQNLPIFMRGIPIDVEDVRGQYVNDGFHEF